MAPLKYRLPPLGECSRNPSVSVYQLALLWEAVLSFSEFFWRFFQHVCPFHDGWFTSAPAYIPHCTECSADFDQKWHDPHAPPSLFTWSCPKWLFFVSLDEKCSQRETFCQYGRSEKKRQKHQKASKSMCSILFCAVGKMSQQVYYIKWRVLWRWLKFKHVRINTQFL